MIAEALSYVDDPLRRVEDEDEGDEEEHEDEDGEKLLLHRYLHLSAQLHQVPDPRDLLRRDAIFELSLDRVLTLALELQNGGDEQHAKQLEAWIITGLTRGGEIADSFNELVEWMQRPHRWLSVMGSEKESGFLPASYKILEIVAGKGRCQFLENLHTLSEIHHRDDQNAEHQPSVQKMHEKLWLQMLLAREGKNGSQQQHPSIVRIDFVSWQMKLLWENAISMGTTRSYSDDDNDDDDDSVRKMLIVLSRDSDELPDTVRRLLGIWQKSLSQMSAMRDCLLSDLLDSNKISTPLWILYLNAARDVTYWKSDMTALLEMRLSERIANNDVGGVIRVLVCARLMGVAKYSTWIKTCLLSTTSVFKQTKEYLVTISTSLCHLLRLEISPDFILNHLELMFSSECESPVELDEYRIAARARLEDFQVSFEQPKASKRKRAGAESRREDFDHILELFDETDSTIPKALLDAMQFRKHWYNRQFIPSLIRGITTSSSADKHRRLRLVRLLVDGDHLPTTFRDRCIEILQDNNILDRLRLTLKTESKSSTSQNAIKPLAPPLLIFNKMTTAVLQTRLMHWLRDPRNSMHDIASSITAIDSFVRSDWRAPSLTMRLVYDPFSPLSLFVLPENDVARRKYHGMQKLHEEFPSTIHPLMAEGVEVLMESLMILAGEHLSKINLDSGAETENANEGEGGKEKANLLLNEKKENANSFKKQGSIPCLKASVQLMKCLMLHSSSLFQVLCIRIWDIFHRHSFQLDPSGCFFAAFLLSTIRHCEDDAECSSFLYVRVADPISCRPIPSGLTFLQALFHVPPTYCDHLVNWILISTFFAELSGSEKIPPSMTHSMLIVQRRLLMMIDQSKDENESRLIAQLLNALDGWETACGISLSNSPTVSCPLRSLVFLEMVHPFSVGTGLGLLNSIKTSNDELNATIVATMVQFKMHHTYSARSQCSISEIDRIFLNRLQQQIAADPDHPSEWACDLMTRLISCAASSRQRAVVHSCLQILSTLPNEILFFGCSLSKAAALCDSIASVWRAKGCDTIFLLHIWRSLYLLHARLQATDSNQCFFALLQSCFTFSALLTEAPLFMDAVAQERDFVCCKIHRIEVVKTLLVISQDDGVSENAIAPIASEIRHLCLPIIINRIMYEILQSDANGARLCFNNNDMSMELVLQTMCSIIRWFQSGNSSEMRQPFAEIQMDAPFLKRFAQHHRKHLDMISSILRQQVQVRNTSAVILLMTVSARLDLLSHGSGNEESHRSDTNSNLKSNLMVVTTDFGVHSQRCLKLHRRKQDQMVAWMLLAILMLIDDHDSFLFSTVDTGDIPIVSAWMAVVHAQLLTASLDVDLTSENISQAYPEGQRQLIAQACLYSRSSLLYLQASSGWNAAYNRAWCASLECLDRELVEMISSPSEALIRIPRSVFERRARAAATATLRNLLCIV